MGQEILVKEECLLQDFWQEIESTIKGNERSGCKTMNAAERSTQVDRGSKEDRCRIHRGEPGCHVVTELKDGSPVTENLPVALAPSSFPSPAIPAHYMEIAHLRVSLILALKKHIVERTGPKKKAINEFVKKFNAGSLLPNIHEELKEVSIKTLYRWQRKFDNFGVDGLIPQYGGAGKSKVTDDEGKFLLAVLLNPNRIKIGSAITFLKNHFKEIGLKSESSSSTLRRCVDDFKKTKYDVWVNAREGAKALNDKCLPYAERDWRLLSVGEGLVADGHRLNFRVINPFTGKPCRATIVLFWDWKSAYPLGWEIMLEENIQCIASALRNAILCLGKIPKWLLIDNGKAFKANVFTSDVDLEDGITYGMFATLGIHTHFAQAYNPQSKPLERFWGIFNNWFERLLPSYSGASIPDKPAYMMRNEKDAQAKHNDWVPKIEELQKMMFQWREFYADQPSRGRDGMKPKDIFEGEILSQTQDDKRIDPTDLEFLMMAKEIKTVHRNGITWNGWNYFDEAMYGYKSKVIVRFSHSDYSQLLVYMPLRNSYCIAKPIEPVHPMAAESEFPKDREAVKQFSALKSRVRRGTKNLLTLIESGAMKEVDWKRSPDVEKVVEMLESKDHVVRNSPFLEEDFEKTWAKHLKQNEESEEKEGEVNPRTGRTAPILEYGWEIYDWYRKRDRNQLNAEDISWIEEYRQSDQWGRIYKQKEEREAREAAGS
jgi:putative transposase